MQTHVQSTLLELVSTLNSFIDSDHEVVALNRTTRHWHPAHQNYSCCALRQARRTFRTNREIAHCG